MELLLLKLLLVLLQELLVLLLHHQLLQGQGLGVSLRGAPLRQRGRLGPPQWPVLPLQLGHGCRWGHRQAAHTLGHKAGGLQLLDEVKPKTTECKLVSIRSFLHELSGRQLISQEKQEQRLHCFNLL